MSISSKRSAPLFHGRTAASTMLAHKETKTASLGICLHVYIWQNTDYSAVTHDISVQICDYIGVKVPAFTCAPKPASKVVSSTSFSQSHDSHIPTPTSTPHSTSTHSTLRTSTRSSAQSSHTPTGTTSLVQTHLSSSHTLPHPSSTAPPASLSTLSVYNGFAGAYCYTEGPSGHALDGASTTSANMTIETCLDFCEKDGWGWAGLQNGNE